MKFSYFNRRLHLYLSLALLPWFLMYGVSSVVFSHNRYFDERARAQKQPEWIRLSERPYDVPVPAGDLRPLGAQIMKDAGENTAFGVYRPNPRQINVYAFTFRSQKHLIYFPEEKRLIIEQKRFRPDHFLTTMHARGGFDQEDVLNDSWAIVVDIVCLGMLLWVASGLYMWWQLKGHRHWGMATLIAGATSFTLFLLRL